MKIVRKNGKVFRDRLCPVCGVSHFHGDNMCITCRNARQAPRRKYIPIRETMYPTDRARRLEAHRVRIEAEMEAIRRAGLDPANDTVQTIIDTDIQLDNSIHCEAFERIAV